MPGFGIHTTELILLVLVAFAAALAGLAQRLKIPYPIFLVLGGVLLGFIPAFPDIQLNPTFIFLVVLPPLLYGSALKTSWREFRHNLVSISMLAFGLVSFTVVGVAFAAHLFFPGFDWRAGLVLGAVVCTTDTIAVAAVAKQVGLPSHLLDLIEGESLVNDATGLLALNFSVALVASGEIPTLAHGIGELLLLVVGGIVTGLVVGKVMHWIQSSIQDSALHTVVGIAIPYVAYLLGESIHASGVLAVVTCGLFVGRMASFTFSSEARVDSQAVWNTVEFALNALVFILIGLQLPAILDGIRGSDWHHLLLIGSVLCVLLLALRMVWMYPGSWISRQLRTHVFHMKDQSQPNPRQLFVIGWSGMRGVLTLAAALSLPTVTDAGAPFPHRATIIFLAFTVIAGTLVGQGLSLPPIIRLLNVCGPKGALEEENRARRSLLTAALHALDERRVTEPAADHPVNDLIESYYKQRLKSVAPREAGQAYAAEQNKRYTQISGELRAIERLELLRLLDQNEIGGETAKRLERELDLLDLRWPTA